MPGRHASAVQKGTSASRVIVIVIVVVAVIGATFFGIRQLLDARAGSCDQDQTATVAAGPAMATVLEKLIPIYAEADGGADDGCARLEVVAKAEAEVAASVGTPEAPDLWIPDSGLWTQRLDDPSLVENLGSTASSPLVIVTPRTAAEKVGWPDEQMSWPAMVSSGTFRIADPATTTEGLASVLAIQSSLRDAEELQKVGAMATIARVEVPSVSDAYQQVSNADGAATLLTATEQSVIAHNETTDGNGVVAVYPPEGTVAFDYPALAVRHEQERGTAPRAVADFVDFLGSPEALDRLREAGFRSPDGRAHELAGVVDGTQPEMPELLEMPDAETVTALLQQWTAISMDMRMLTVIDVSGSMNAEVADGSTRIEVTRDAARSAIDLLPPTSEVGLWVFSVLLDPPNRHHLELSPIAALNEPDDDRPHVDDLIEAINSLPDQVGGGTALYDVTLAAFQQMNESYAPGKVNSVVLMTDGRDEDNPASIGLDALLETLGDEFDQEAPVPIITIGIGPDADMNALQQISEATGTTAYRAENPADIQEVFTRAMLERQCRPNC